jgi:hypothetical protein
VTQNKTTPSASICKEISLQKEILVLAEYLQGKMQGIKIYKEI